MPNHRANLSLVADIGGTNTRVALADGKALIPDSIRRFRNADHPGLEPILRGFLADAGHVDCGGVCVAVAGPVADGVATMTNLDWVIDQPELTSATGAEMVAILNDLQAQGHALGHIAADKLRPVFGTMDPQAAKAKLVIGIGTGFNAAPVHETPWGRMVAASECGHINMPVRSSDDLKLAQFVIGRQGFAGVEEVLSGRGLERIFSFVATQTGQAEDRAAADIVAALERGEKDDPAQAAARLFVRLLGTETGNLALIHLPFGGIYLCGGVARAFTPYLEAMGFEAAFRDKGRFADFMDRFAVSIIEDDYAALTGCAAYLASGAQG
ncbi:glucokinase [Pseudorhodobacter sp.]|uniref:glucokinase n=1 Tax=Pseudorhodobacter sp. TaxID=1934400 RepID=UPI0026482205|nr:glucokinase [Pseudorhodobacter sp.]MDN5788277.1 glucokinase [Pseudorhodobacter sp.]